MEEIYYGEISENVNWGSGIDEETGKSATGNLPVSGESIQQLIRKHLKQPFVPYEDVSAGLYRMFSSESIKNKYINISTPTSPDYDPDSIESFLTKYQLFSFVRPGDVALTIDNFSTNPRYILKGDSSNNNAVLEFNIVMKKDTAGVKTDAPDNFSITYTIKDAEGKTTTISQDYGESKVGEEDEKKIRFSIFDYLKEGTNEITIYAKAKNSNAEEKKTLTIYLVEFTLESSFLYYRSVSGSSIDIPLLVRKSVSGLTLKVSAYVDGSPAILSSNNAQAIWETNSPDVVVTNDRFAIRNTYAANSVTGDHIKHTLRLEAELSGGPDNTVFHSNVLFYDFVVASNVQDILNKFANIHYDTPYNKLEMDGSNVILRGTQYEPFVLDWAYYTDQLKEQSINIQWALKTVDGEDITYEPVTNLIGNNGYASEALRFIPTYPISMYEEVYLVARYNNLDIDLFRIIISENPLNINETEDYNLKLSAYGKSNSANNRDHWDYPEGGVTSTFSSSIKFDSIAGWDNNSLFLSGSDNIVTVNYNPFPRDYHLDRNGKTIEIEFNSEKIDTNDDIIAMIGNENSAHIDITPVAAYLRLGSDKKPIIQTNYKSNERVKLCFVFNPVDGSSKSSNLVYIINNGILERVANWGASGVYENRYGNIKLGGSNSGVRIYTIRGYNKAISYTQALNNFIYDSDDRGSIIARNDIIVDNNITRERCENTIDTILIEGNLGILLSPESRKKDSETTVKITRKCVADRSKDFTVTNGMIRKHGQSTLSYPITSFKIWFNKNTLDKTPPVLELSSSLTALGLNKNRYIMKDGAIPANKFVLQANYADSSGVHNGAIERLIQKTWYEANIDGEYKLRTAPLLFASNHVIHHNDATIGETGQNAWVEGYGIGAAADKGWTDLTGKDFPYIIRNSPDSFPCAVFYIDHDGDGREHFLGQYVFMDDKKSDHIYGERSIYSFGENNDPFVLRTENTKNGVNGKQDIAENKVWDNGNVLRIECVLLNNKLTSFMDFKVPASEIDPETGEPSSSAQEVDCTGIRTDERGNPIQYYWEDYFELIYPDPDDIEEDEGKTKFDSDSKFNRKTKPFIDFLRWITGIGALNTGTKIPNTRVTQAALDQFKATAAQHLDLYKCAAYYTFFLRFGLIDSVERNAQLKTYDGIHWHYEPWDLDIAAGNTNKGWLALYPPLDRDSFVPDSEVYAYSGRSANTSNVLWDCLEAWPQWLDIVKKVAAGLYNNGRGLSYDVIMSMMDGEYAEKWPETMYNESGYFKYIQNGGIDWFAWLQGARTTHRHWWISTSMNYYDAKWGCGSFMDHRVKLFADKIAKAVGTDLITISPTASTFFDFVWAEGTKNIGTTAATKQSPAVFDLSPEVIAVKDPAYIYGGQYIESIDLSCIANGIEQIDFSLCYDEVLGAPIKEVNLGNAITLQQGQLKGAINRMSTFSLTASNPLTLTDAFLNLRTLDVTGQYKLNNSATIFVNQDRRNIENFYAAGTGITQFENAPGGNKFNTIKIPAYTTTHSGGESNVSYMKSITLHSASWLNLEFYNVDIVSGEGTYELTTIPSDVTNLVFDGSTAANECSGQLLLDWIQSIEDSLPSGYTEADLNEALGNKTFLASGIRWGSTDPNYSLKIYYNDLKKIAQFNQANNSGGTLTGYILISDPDPLTTVQLSNLKSWFGSTVFDKASINSGLIIDQATDYVQISVEGTTLLNNELYLNEKSTATLSANKFMLSDDDTAYQWAIMTAPTQPLPEDVGWIEANVLNINNQVNSCKIEIGGDGIARIRTEEGAFGNYPLWVKASYENSLGVVLSLIIKINIVGVTYPTNVVFNAGTGARDFLMSESMAVGLFGQEWAKDQNNNLIDTYVMFERGHQVDFYASTVGDFNATVKKIEYRLLSIDNSSNVLNYTEQSVINNGSNETQYIGDDLNLGYNGMSTHSGINVVTLTPPSTMRRYRLTCRVTIGGAEPYIRMINLVVYDDSAVIVRGNTSSLLYQAISERYRELYNNAPVGAFNIMKTHLWSLYGTLDFSSKTGITSIISVPGDSVLKYTPNITGLVFDGCNNLPMTDIASQQPMLDLSNITNLLSLSLSGCSSMYGTLDLTGCIYLTSLNTYGTTLGVTLPEHTPISTLTLGSPTSVKIEKPTVLDDITITSNSNLTNIELDNINGTSSKTFYILNKLL